MSKSALWMVALLIGSGVWVGVSVAEEKEKEEEMAGAGMPEWVKLTDDHNELKKFVGKWKASSPMMSGTSKTEMMHGGRFVRAHFSGTAEGFEMKGEWTCGYSPALKKFQSVWMDSFSPHVYTATGVKGEDGKITFMGTDPDMMTGAMGPAKMVIEWKDKDTYVMSFFVTKDGELAPHGMFTYTRVK